MYYVVKRILTMPGQTEHTCSGFEDCNEKLLGARLTAKMNMNVI